MATVLNSNRPLPEEESFYSNIPVLDNNYDSATGDCESVYQELRHSTVKVDNRNEYATATADNNEYASIDFKATGTTATAIIGTAITSTANNNEYTSTDFTTTTTTDFTAAASTATNNIHTSCSKKAQENEIKSISNKRFFCILVTLVLVLLAAIACFVAVFAEVTSLRSKQDRTASMQMVYSNENLLLIQQLNHSLDERVTDQAEELKDALLNNFNDHQAIYQQLSAVQIEINDFTRNLYQLFERDMIMLNLTSCTDLPPSFPSGYYWVRASDVSAVRVYCDMTRSCGGVTGGWMRVAELDMTNSSHQCPSGLTQRNTPDIRTCVRSVSQGGHSTVTYSTHDINYTRVCGRIIGYQVGTTNAFFRRFQNVNNINSNYVDGVSLTHGDPRQHIWTFAAALDKTGGDVNNVESLCPCQSTPPTHPPSFVGTDYFCDAGNEQYTYGETGFQTDPLWDGAGCPCCAHPPWFYKQLPQPTTDNIEMRVCRDEVKSNEDIAIQVVEIYVH